MIGRGISLFSLLAICALLIGCGGGGSDTTGGADTGGGSSAAETTSEGGTETSGGEGEGEEGESEPSEGEEGEASEGEEGGSAGGAITFSGKPTKKAEFIKSGDAICEKVPRRYQAKLKGLEKELKSLPKKKKEEEETLQAALPPLRIASEEFQDLGAPQGEEDKAVEIVELLEAGADGLEKEPKAPLSGPGSPFEEFSKVTEKYGFKFCTGL